MWAIKDALYKLPAPNFFLCKYLIGHLVHVTEHENVNQMFATNLAIVFGPTLFRYPGTNPNTAEGMQYLGQFSSIVKNLIIQYHWLFDVEAPNQPAQKADDAQPEQAAQPIVEDPFADPVNVEADDISEPEDLFNNEDQDFEDEGEEVVKGLVGEEFGMEVGLTSPAIVDYYAGESDSEEKP